MREKGKDQIDGITNYIYIENFPTLATPSYTDLEQQTPTEGWTSRSETGIIKIQPPEADGGSWYDKSKEYSKPDSSVGFSSDGY